MSLFLRYWPIPSLSSAGEQLTLRVVARHADVWHGFGDNETLKRKFELIDGYEQLSRWNRFCLQRRCKRWGHGLLVTAHSDVGLPELYRTGVTVETAVRVAREAVRVDMATYESFQDVFVDKLRLSHQPEPESA